MQKKVVLPFPQLDDLPAYNPKDGPIAPREGLLTDDMMAAHSLVRTLTDLPPQKCRAR